MASINDKLRKYKSLFSTTLSTGIGTGTSDTITPATVTGLPTDTAITLTIDRVDSSGTATPSKLERIKGIISGGNLIDYVRGVDGTTEQSHTAGAVVEMVWNAADLNDIVDWGLVEHSQLGVHDKTKVVDLTTAQTLTNKTLTAPLFNGNVDGWISANETWAYASATTITVPSGAAAKYAKGDKIKLTQTTVKYFYIVGVADTVLTVVGNGSVVVTDATISANYYSHASSPIGFPSYFSFTPTISAESGTITTASGTIYFSIFGSVCYILYGYITITNNGTGSAKVKSTIPLNPANDFYCSIYGQETSTTGKTVSGAFRQTSFAQVAYYDNTYPGANGATIKWNGFYNF